MAGCKQIGGRCSSDGVSETSGGVAKAGKRRESGRWKDLNLMQHEKYYQVWTSCRSDQPLPNTEAGIKADQGQIYEVGVNRTLSEHGRKAATAKAGKEVIRLAARLSNFTATDRYSL